MNVLFKQVTEFSWANTKTNGEDDLNEFLQKMGDKVIDIQYQKTPLNSQVLVTWVVTD